MKYLILIITFLGLGIVNTNAQNNLTEIEYFFNEDPGVGNANAIALANSNSLSETFTIPINQLPSGIHILHIRTKNNANQWSIYARQTFYISNFSNALNNTITEAEYFFNEDPGIGNATALNVNEGTTLNDAFSIPLNGLETGIHILYIRVKNNLNQWSLYARQVFYNTPEISNKNIVAAEFFIDVDPGVGNATTIDLTANQSIDETLNILIPSDLPEGDHVLHIRVLDSNGSWSLYHRPEFSNTLSIENIALKSFRMYPNPVSHTLYFSKENLAIKQLQLIDMQGRVIKKASHNMEHFDMSNIASGSYLVQIETTHGKLSKKIIKQ